jgi:hypothetical protein
MHVFILHTTSFNSDTSIPPPPFLRQLYFMYKAIKHEILSIHPTPHTHPYSPTSINTPNSAGILNLQLVTSPT